MSTAETSPEELAREAQRGSKAAFGRLVERFQEPLFNYLMVRTRNAADAEELAQEAFLRAWSRIGTFDDRWRFSTWLYAVARNLSVSRLRSGRAPEATLVDVAGEGGEPSRPLSDTDLRQSLWDLAGRVLSEEQRDALWLRYSEDLSPLEIARVLGRRPSSVRVLLFRARARLAAAVDDADDAHPPSTRIHILGESR